MLIICGVIRDRPTIDWRSFHPIVIILCMAKIVKAGANWVIDIIKECQNDRDRDPAQRSGS